MCFFHNCNNINIIWKKGAYGTFPAWRLPLRPIEM